MNFNRLEAFHIRKRDDSSSANTCSPPHAPKRWTGANFKSWYEEIEAHKNGGEFLCHLIDYLSADTGTKVAVLLCSEPIGELQPLFRIVTSARLECLVVVNPFSAEDGSMYTCDNTKVLVVREDPLSFLSQIENGPSVLAHSFYDDATFPNEGARSAYYSSLASECVRMISNSRNMLRAPGFVGASVPVLSGWNPDIFVKLVGADTKPDEWLVEPAMSVFDDEDPRAMTFVARRVPRSRSDS